MKRYTQVLKNNEWGEFYTVMEEDPNGKYVLAEDAYLLGGYKWDYKTASWVKPDAPRP